MAWPHQMAKMKALAKTSQYRQGDASHNVTPSLKCCPRNADLEGNLNVLSGVKRGRDQTKYLRSSPLRFVWRFHLRFAPHVTELSILFSAPQTARTHTCRPLQASERAAACGRYSAAKLRLVHPGLRQFEHDIRIRRNELIHVQLDSRAHAGHQNGSLPGRPALDPIQPGS